MTGFAAYPPRLFYSMVVTFISSHFIRLGYLRLFGATIGKGMQYRGKHRIPLR